MCTADVLGGAVGWGSPGRVRVFLLPCKKSLKEMFAAGQAGHVDVQGFCPPISLPNQTHKLDSFAQCSVSLAGTINCSL